MDESTKHRDHGLFPVSWRQTTMSSCSHDSICTLKVVIIKTMMTKSPNLNKVVILFKIMIFPKP